MVAQHRGRHPVKIFSSFSGVSLAEGREREQCMERIEEGAGE